jgi:hypothetical protein
MKILSAGSILVLMAVLTGASPAAAGQLDMLDLKERNRWSCAKSVALKIFPVEAEFQGERGRSRDFYQKLFARRFSDQLRKIKGIERVDLVDGKSPITADLLIDGTFRDFTAGSRSLRFWVGFGAGKSFCRAEMTATDPKSGTEIFSLDHARGSAMNILDEDQLDVNITEVVEDVAETLSSLRGDCILHEAEADKIVPPRTEGAP